jgi:hypothetical protein
MVIFGAGVVTGGLLVRRTAFISQQQQQRPSAWARTNVVSAGGQRVDFLRRVQRELDLSPDQRNRVDRILRESQERSRKVMEPVSPLLREEMQRTREEFRAVLDPAQRAIFDELLKHPQPQRPRDARTPKDRPPDGPGRLPTEKRSPPQSSPVQPD